MTDVVGSERDVEFEASDGWRLFGRLRTPGSGPAPGVVLVAGSRHERDAWTDTAAALGARSVASLRFDIRGRGASIGSTPYAQLPVGLRRRVVLDVAAAIDHLASLPEVDANRLGVIAEQDTAPDAATAATDDSRIVAVALLSARGGGRLARAVATRPVAVHGMVSTEDRFGLRATVDAYLAGREDGSRLDVFDGLGFGITMASVRRFEHPDAEPIEAMLATWMAARLGA